MYLAFTGEEGMALVANRYQNEQDLLWLLATLRSAMQRLASHVLITPGEWGAA